MSKEEHGDRLMSPYNGATATIRRHRSRTPMTSLPLAARSAATKAHLACAALLVSTAAWAQTQEPAQEPPKEDSSVYPTAPATAPPATKVENSEPGPGGELRPYAELITGTDVTFTMTPIPEGTFLMGSPADEADRKDWEGPQIPVKVSAFWMGTHEVRWNEYSVFMDSLDKRRRAKSEGTAEAQDAWADAVSRPTPPYVPMDFDMGTDGYPAISMTQFAAKQYTKWLSMKTGRFYRLPTEAEWEYAARAGTQSPHYFDSESVNDFAWWFDNCDGQYQPPGKLKPNAFGLYDMSGNVCEWCLDAFTDNGYEHLLVDGKAPTEPVLDPLNWPTELYPRVARGGHWDDDPDRLRSAARRGSNRNWKSQDPQLPKSIWYHTDAQWLGIRLVRPLTPPPFEEWPKYHDANLEEIEVIQDRQRSGER